MFRMFPLSKCVWPPLVPGAEVQGEGGGVLQFVRVELLQLGWRLGGETEDCPAVLVGKKQSVRLLIVSCRLEEWRSERVFI